MPWTPRWPRATVPDRIGTVVATGGTTSLGAVDPVDAIVARCRSAGVRVHLDAAYGGFFRLLADDDRADGGRADGGSNDDPGDGGAADGSGAGRDRAGGHPAGVGLPAEVAAAFRAMGACDSVVIDPHKHGLQPYGCGAVLFRDAAVGRLYAHDSPYTYFTSDELHLGEISLECSRAGASAAALWATLRCLPIERDRGLGPVLAKSQAAARRVGGTDRGAPPYAAGDAAGPGHRLLVSADFGGSGPAERFDAGGRWPAGERDLGGDGAGVRGGDAARRVPRGGGVLPSPS
jgi:glutamate/tyrosine decarboxylase-like PLP-dependent enzyme